MTAHMKSAQRPYRTTRQVAWWLIAVGGILATILIMPFVVQGAHLDRTSLVLVVACGVVAVGVADWGYQTLLGRRAGLIGAIRYGNMARTKALLAHGVNVDRRDIRGKCALHYAVEQGEIDTVGLLLGYGALPTVRDKNGATPLHYAAAINSLPSDAHKRMLRHLLNAGADPRVRDHCEQRPEDWALSDEAREILADAISGKR